MLGTTGQKERYVTTMFASIARQYDAMNLVMTAGMYRYWQRVFRRLNGVRPGDRCLDVGCGTGDLSIILGHQVGPSGRVTGIDLTPGMVEVGWAKVRRAGLERRVSLEIGNALSLPFEAGSFDVVTIGFALRNISDIDRAIGEMMRVVKKGGRVVCLELTKPENALVKVPYYFYFYRIVPLLGRLAGDDPRIRAYTYLPHSLTAFPDRHDLADRFKRQGASEVRIHPLTGGIVAIHIAEK